MNFNLPHIYKVNANTERESYNKVNSENLPELKIAPPKKFGGPGNVWSPEDLFVATVANCFLMTFKAVSSLSKLEWISLECSAEGKLDRVDNQLQFTEIKLNAKLNLPADGNKERAIRLLHKAEQNCLVTNSIKTKVTLEAEANFAE